MNLNLTHQDHLRWSLDGKMFAPRTSHDQRFAFQVGSSISCGSWKQELDKSVDALIADHGTKLTLFYSGGADSEVVLRELTAHGVVPDVHTIRFAGGLNEHEIQNAFEVCKQFGITPHVWEHDQLDYIHGQKYMDLALKYQCSQLAYLTVLEYARRVDTPVVMGGEVYLQKHQRPGGPVHASTSWYYIYREDEDGVTYRYSHQTGHKIVNEFFSYTPGLLASWLSHPMIRRVTNDEIPGKITLLSVKHPIYEQELGYKLAANSKFHGYESLLWANIHVQRNLKKMLHTSGVCRYEYNKLLSHLC